MAPRNGQTILAANLGMDANFFRQASNRNIDLCVVDATMYSNGSGTECQVTPNGSITPTTDAMRTDTLAPSSLVLVQPCQGRGFNSGVASATQALAQPIGCREHAALLPERQHHHHFRHLDGIWAAPRHHGRPDGLPVSC